MAIALDQKEGRLDLVTQYSLLGRPKDGAFDHIAQVARQYLNCKAAVVSIVDKERIWFEAHPGIPASSLDLDDGLCASAVLQDEPWIVNDAAIDPRTLANPVVAGDLGLRFYAGIPLKTKGGFNLGVLAVIDFEPRTISEDDLAVLKHLAMITVEIMDLRLELFLALSQKN